MIGIAVCQRSRVFLLLGIDKLVKIDIVQNQRAISHF